MSINSIAGFWLASPSQKNQEHKVITKTIINVSRVNKKMIVCQNAYQKTLDNTYNQELQIIELPSRANQGRGTRFVRTKCLL